MIDKTINAEKIKSNILSLNKLDKKQLTELSFLEDLCSKYDNLNFKMEWSYVKQEFTDERFLLYIENNIILGYLGIYSYHETEAEILCFVHPEHRLNGIGRTLFDLAIEKCKQKNIKRILNICNNSSVSGTAFAKSISERYAFSEYSLRMNKEDFKNVNQEAFITHGITLEEVSDEKTVAKLNEKTIGQISRELVKEEGYIFAFLVNAEFRGHGYGREILLLTIIELWKKGAKTIKLEVACKNKVALSLYTSCGFKETTVYDYYEILLQHDFVPKADDFTEFSK